jgi:hypothetical protein
MDGVLVGVGSLWPLTMLECMIAWTTIQLLTSLDDDSYHDSFHNKSSLSSLHQGSQTLA